jgi:hypothetical protein
MISIVMPYWERPTALREVLPRFERQYGGKLDIEVIIPDDSSEQYPACVTDNYSFPVTIVRMPKKSGRKNPCGSFIAGIRRAVGGMILLTSPETEHIGAILFPMEKKLRDLGMAGAVTPRVRSGDENVWYVHEDLPKIRPFCLLLYRDHYWACGGHDMAYRDVMAYDDDDLMMRLADKDTRLCLMTDVMVNHRVSWCDGNTKWDDLADHHIAGMKIFQKRWGQKEVFKRQQNLVVV